MSSPSPHRARLYAHLRHLAENNLPCPSNAELARVVNYSNPHSVSDAIHHFCANGKLKRLRGDNPRCFLVTEIGRTTQQTRRDISDIIALVAKAACLSVEDVTGQGRQRIYIRPRIICAHYARAEGWSYPEIGRAMGRNHSTLVHACEQVEPLLRHDKLFARLFHRVGDMIEGISPPVLILPPKAPQPRQLRPLDVDPDDRKQMDDLRGRRRGSAMLLDALRREHPQRIAA